MRVYTYYIYIYIHISIYNVFFPDNSALSPIVSPELEQRFLFVIFELSLSPSQVCSQLFLPLERDVTSRRSSFKGEKMSSHLGVSSQIGLEHDWSHQQMWVSIPPDGFGTCKNAETNGFWGKPKQEKNDKSCQNWNVHRPKSGLHSLVIQQK